MYLAISLFPLPTSPSHCPSSFKLGAYPYVLGSSLPLTRPTVASLKAGLTGQAGAVV